MKEMFEDLILVIIAVALLYGFASVIMLLFGCCHE